MRLRPPPLLWATAIFRCPPRSACPSAQAEAARDDAAEDFRGPALDGGLRRDRRRIGQLILERGVVETFGFEERRQIAHTRRQFLFPHRAEILDNRALDHRFLAGL